MAHHVVIGGGIVGLATAYRIVTERPRATVTVLEKEDQVAAHQTGHNSGVIHAGVYYRPGSLKARLCRAGATSMVNFCTEHGIPVQVCGKLIVASSEGSLVMLSAQTGEVLHTISLKSKVYVPPIIASGTIYILADDGDLIAMR